MHGSLVKELQFFEAAAIIGNRVWAFAGRGLVAEHAFASLRKRQCVVTNAVSSLKMNQSEYRKGFCPREANHVVSSSVQGSDKVWRISYGYLNRVLVRSTIGTRGLAPRPTSQRLTLGSRVSYEGIEKAKNRPHGYPNKLPMRSVVGARGFEPPTSRTRTVRSKPN